MSDDPSAGDSGWIANEFLRRFIADEQAGRQQALEHYQAAWPGHEALIAAEHARLVGDDAPSEPEESAAPPGYALHAALGSGRLARAWVVVHEASGEHRLLKRYEYLPLGDRDGFIERLDRLPRRIPRGVPGLAAIHATGFEDGVAFVISDLTSQETLAARLEDPGLPREQGLRGLVRVARALHALHEAGEIHGDVRPASLRFDAAGEMVLCDAGWAGALGPDWSHMVRDEAVGDLAYRAPEELLVNQTGADPATDQHALAATAYHYLARQPAFDAGDRAALGQAILTMAPRPLRERDPTIPREVEKVLMRALAKDPAERWSHLEAFAGALDQALRRRPSRISRFLGRG